LRDILSDDQQEDRFHPKRSKPHYEPVWTQF